jgi:hypothetical protein
MSSSAFDPRQTSHLQPATSVEVFGTRALMATQRLFIETALGEILSTNSVLSWIEPAPRGHRKKQRRLAVTK